MLKGIFCGPSQEQELVGLIRASSVVGAKLEMVGSSRAFRTHRLSSILIGATQDVEPIAYKFIIFILGRLKPISPVAWRNGSALLSG